jgi:preprotein translocase subunit YajC
VPAEVQLLVIVIALLGFWAIVMRPARVQQRRVAQLQADVAVGDEVIISAGIFGTVVALEDDRVRLEIAPGTVITVARQVVVRRAPDESPDESPDEPTTGTPPDAASADTGTEED